VFSFIHSLLSCPTCSPGSHPSPPSSSPHNMFIPLPLILIIRLFTAALLLAHTLLFSIPRFFDYRHLATWANAFLLAAALLATFLSLHQLISTTHDDDDDDEIDFAADVPPSKAANPFFASILPAMTYPILQSAGASAIIASVIHWSTADAVPPANSFVQRYVRYSLYAANPALYVLDLVLAASFSPRLRLRNVPFTWLFVAIYYAFVAISDRSQLPSGTRDVATVIAVTVVVPLLLVLLAAFIPSICGVASAAYRSKRKSVPTDDVENNLTHIQASVTTLGPACPEFQPQAIESTHSTLPKPDRPAHPTLESPPPIAQKPDRPTNPSTTGLRFSKSLEVICEIHICKFYYIFARGREGKGRIWSIRTHLFAGIGIIGVERDHGPNCGYAP